MRDCVYLATTHRISKLNPWASLSLSYSHIATSNNFGNSKEWNELFWLTISSSLFFQTPLKAKYCKIKSLRVKFLIMRQPTYSGAGSYACKARHSLSNLWTSTRGLLQWIFFWTSPSTLSQAPTFLCKNWSLQITPNESRGQFPKNVKILLVDSSLHFI